MTVVPKLAHVVLQTGQLPVMRDWYRTVLGAHIVYENAMTCFLTFDEEHHRIALVELPPEVLTGRTPTTVGLSHTAFTFPSLGELIGKYLDLRQAGIQPHVPVQHGVTTSLYYRDPDDNTVELQIDNFATPDEATTYTHGEEFAADAMGPTFDAVAWAAAFQAGIPVSELTSRSWAARSPQHDAMTLLST